MDSVTLLLFLLGLGLLLVGAELLVRGSATLAERVGIPPLVVGLTVVAFGTSSPEFAVTIQSALEGRADLALGNVVGSNVFNVLFILGISGLVAPLVVSRQLVRVEVPVMIAVSALVWVLALDGVLARWEGFLLVSGLAAYLVFQIRGARKDPSPSDEPPAPGVPTVAEAKKASIPVQLVLIVVGLGMLVLGSRWLVNGAVEVATRLGVSQLVIGLTVVAAGTSLPEVATSVLASLRGQRDIAVGNVVGSNVFNLLGVLGVAGALSTGIVIPAAALSFDLPVMTVLALACLPIFFTGMAITRWEAGIFLGYYGAYTTYLILRAAEHDALDEFSAVLLWFVVPLTLLTLGTVAWRKRRKPVPGGG
jgi:cation:H+ antiporter